VGREKTADNVDSVLTRGEAVLDTAGTNATSEVENDEEMVTWERKSERKLENSRHEINEPFA